MKKTSLLIAIACLILPDVGVTGEADWPQWRGPNRDGHATPQSLLQQWPDGGPQLKWQAENLGRGYSSVSVVGNRLYTMGSLQQKCVLICLDASSGDLIWQQNVSRAGTRKDYNVGWGAGPRGTPTIDGGQVFVLTDVGVLAGLDSESGALQWSIDLVKDHGGEIPEWGYSESPLVDGNRVVITPGEKNFMIAVDRSNGKQVWASRDVDARAQYVSVMKGSVGDRSFYVTASAPGLFAFDTESGENLFRDTTTGNGIAVVPTPVLSETFLYHSSAYGAGNTLLKLAASGTGIDAESIYHLSGKSMENHHGGFVLVEGVIYGFTNANRGNWLAQDLRSGRTLWRESVRPNRSGSICFADGRLYCYNDDEGSVLLVQPDRQVFIQKGKLQIPEQTRLDRGSGAIWAHPVVANQTLFIRDQDLMFAYDIAR